MNRSRIPTLVFALCLLLAGLALPAAGQQESPAPASTTTPEEEANILYLLGVALSSNLGSLRITEEELQQVQQGIADGALGRQLRVDPQVYGPRLQAFVAQRTQAAADAEKARSAEYLTVAAAAEGALQTDSGLVYTEIAAGSGASPAPDDTVTVHYRGTLRDGSVFDSSIDRGQPATFALNGVIPCWTEGVQRMKTGGKARLVCPSDIAYGDRGAAPRIPPGAVLTFEVELLEIAPRSPDGDS